jgi:hypothetical protein
VRATHRLHCPRRPHCTSSPALSHWP